MSPSDKTRPNLALLEGLISELGISPAWLLTGEGPMFAAGEDATPLNDATDPVHQAAMWKREALELERDRDAWRAHARELLEEMTRRRPGDEVASAEVLLNEPGVGGVEAEKQESD